MPGRQANQGPERKRRRELESSVLFPKACWHHLSGMKKLHHRITEKLKLGETSRGSESNLIFKGVLNSELNHTSEGFIPYGFENLQKRRFHALFE